MTSSHLHTNLVVSNTISYVNHCKKIISIQLPIIFILMQFETSRLFFFILHLLNENNSDGITLIRLL